jgi:hypothetical protein
MARRGTVRLVCRLAVPYLLPVRGFRGKEIGRPQTEQSVTRLASGPSTPSGARGGRAVEAQIPPDADGPEPVRFAFGQRAGNSRPSAITSGR